jgi:cytochrome c biogenesis protein CcmG/thiol:disulfide interchange protein DsbE
MKKFLIPIGLFVLVGIVLALGLFQDPRRIPSPLIGKPLPAFSLPSLDKPQTQITNADFRGQVVLINVWASWCTACRSEHPVLMELAKQNIAPIVGLNYKDTVPDARGVLTANGDPYKITLVDADGRTGIDWGVYGVPETFVVDKAGVIRHKFIGPITPEDIQKTLLPLIQSLNQQS